MMMLSFYQFKVSMLAIHVRNIICFIWFPVLSGHELEVEITVFDEIGRKFDNFSSLEWKWESTNPSYIPRPDTSHMVTMRSL